MFLASSPICESNSLTFNMIVRRGGTFAIKLGCKDRALTNAISAHMKDPPLDSSTLGKHNGKEPIGPHKTPNLPEF